jgi:hypothetical protein
MVCYEIGQMQIGEAVRQFTWGKTGKSPQKGLGVGVACSGPNEESHNAWDLQELSLALAAEGFLSS